MNTALRFNVFIGFAILHLGQKKNGAQSFPPMGKTLQQAKSAAFALLLNEPIGSRVIQIPFLYKVGESQLYSQCINSSQVQIPDDS